MNRDYWLTTCRMGFSIWSAEDLPLAELLWGDPAVTQYICVTGVFTPLDIENRLRTELNNQANHQVQYWPVFELATNELIGCCGLRPHRANEYEIGFHLRPKFWRQGFAPEAATAVIGYAFTVLQAKRLFAGHNPKNEASRRVLGKLGFIYSGDEFYEPTGLYHPSYWLTQKTAEVGINEHPR